MKKSCGITGIKDPILSGLMSKYGAREGFKIYFKVKDLGINDFTIKNKYLQEKKEVPTRKKISIKPVGQNPSVNSTAMGIESSVGVLSLKKNKDNITTYYKSYKSEKTAAKKVVEMNKELVNRNLQSAYSVVQRKTSKGTIVKLVLKNESTTDTVIDRLIPEASAPLVKAQKEKLRVLNSQKRELETLLPQFSITEKAYEETALRLTKTENLIKETEQDVRRLKELNTVHQLFERAKKDEEWLADFFRKDTYTFEELREAHIKYDSWAVSAVKPGSPHPYLDNLEQKNKKLVDGMNAISTKIATRFGNIMEVRTKEAVLLSSRKHSKDGKLGDLTDDDILSTLVEQDKGMLATTRAYTLNLGKQQPLIMQTLFNNVNKANNQAHNAAFNRIQKLKESAKGLRRKDMGAFYQRDSKGRLSGELLQPAKVEFIDDLRELQGSIDYALLELEVATPNSNQHKRAIAVLQKAHRSRFSFFKQNVAPIDPSILTADISSFITSSIGLPQEIFSDSDTDPVQARKDLEKRFGKAEANRMLKRAKAMTNAFLNQRDALIAERLGDKDVLSPIDVDFIKEWSSLNSPFLAYKSHTTNESVGRGLPTFKYTLAVPNEQNVDGSFSSMVDEYPDMLEFYDIIVDLLEEGRNEIGDISGFMTGLSLPTLEAGFFKEMFEDGTGLLLPKLMDAFRKATSIANEAAYEQPNLHEDVDKIVNQKEINVNSVTSHRITKQVNEEFVKLKVDFIEENGEDALTREVKVELKKDAINTVYTKSSTNLVGIMSMYALNVQTIKAKRAIEPQVQIIKNFIVKGETRAGALNQSASVKAMDYFLDKEFFGIDPGENVGKGGVKVKSREERETGKAIQEMQLKIEEKIIDLENKENSGEVLSQPEMDELEGLREELKDLDKKLEKQGRFFRLSKIGDAALGLTQLIGIGWSPVSATGNVGIGYVANQILAADGRDLSGGSLGRAYGFILGGNVVRFFTFGASKKVIKSMMLDTEVTLADGTVTNLYDAYDETGRLKQDIVSYKTKSAKEARPWDESEFFQYVKHIVEETHGDYNHSVLLKKNFLGRGLSTFRTWMCLNQ